MINAHLSSFWPYAPLVAGMATSCSFLNFQIPVLRFIEAMQQHKLNRYSMAIMFIRFSCTKKGKNTHERKHPFVLLRQGSSRYCAYVRFAMKCARTQRSNIG